MAAPALLPGRMTAGNGQILMFTRPFQRVLQVAAWAAVVEVRHVQIKNERIRNIHDVNKSRK
jgi:hypothetical protein